MSAPTILCLPPNNSDYCSSRIEWEGAKYNFNYADDCGNLHYTKINFDSDGNEITDEWEEALPDGYQEPADIINFNLTIN